MDREQAKKKIIRRLLGTLLILAACVVGGSMLHAPRHSEASGVREEVQAEAVKAELDTESDGNSQFLLYFLIALIVFVVIIAAVVAVVSAVTSVSAAVADEDSEE